MKSSECLEMKLKIKLSHDVAEILNREARIVLFPADILFYGRAINSDKSIGGLVSHMFQVEVSKQEDRIKNLMLLNAEERYITFCKDYPQLHKRIALKNIASYIGVRAASLSRIRKKQKLNEN